MNRKNIFAMIQARMSSKRLPGKVLMKIDGRPMLSYMLERVAAARNINKVVLITSIHPSDDPIAQLCKENNILCYRGSLDDVLDRYYQAAKKFRVDTIVRLTGDCPLMDPQMIDNVIEAYKKNNYDYVANTIPPKWTVPEGMDVEVFSFEKLREAWKNAKKPSEREHVTFYFWQNPKLFSIFQYHLPTDLSAYRLTVDYPRDFEVVKQIFNKLYPKNRLFSYLDIINFLKENEDLYKINSNIKANQGWQSAFEKDKQMVLHKQRSKMRRKSLAMQQRALKRIPGVTQLLSKRPQLFAPGLWPGYFVKAKGINTWDLDGNKYTDMSINGIGANALGFCDPDVDAAVLKAVRNGNSSSLNCPEEVELADLLCEIHPWAQMARFARTGGEAMAIAVRIARAHTKREKIAFCGYHGWHDWYLAANLSQDNVLDGHLLPGLKPAGVPRGLTGTAIPFSYNNINELKKIIDNNRDLAAIVMEPVRNHMPSPGFLQEVRKLASKIGAVLVIDEITAAMRLTCGGAHLLFGIEPDIAVFAKAISNGYPMAAIIGTEKVMQSAQDTFISSTYWTERIGPAAALATIRKHREFKVYRHLITIGKAIQEGWRKAAANAGLKVHVEGIEPLSHFSFEYETGQVMMTLFVQMMLERGFLASGRFYASFAHQDKHVKSYLKAVNETFSFIADEERKGTLLKNLKGPIADSGFHRLT